MKIYKVLTRIFLHPSQMDKSVSFYENLFEQKCELRFKYHEKGLELASIGSFLLISGFENNLKDFKDTKVTFLVDSIDEFEKFLLEQGATILEEPKSVPTGRNMRVRHFDGKIVEYVEHTAKKDKHMDIIYELNQKQIGELHQLYQQEWWTKGRTVEDTKRCVEGSQICIALVDDSDTLQGFSRVLTDYIFKALILDVIVAKNRRGTGLGDKLISLIKKHEKLKRVKNFELYCLPEMCSFYENYGFSNCGDEIKLMRCIK